MVSALVPYKRVDLAIAACGAAGVPLRVAGAGPERERLERLAASLRAEVEFLGALPDGEIRDCYRRAATVLLPGEEDFGIAPVEAQACGRPVVALARGGRSKRSWTASRGCSSGNRRPRPSPSAIRQVLDTRFDPAEVRAHAVRFDTGVFERADAGRPRRCLGGTPGCSSPST